MGGRGRWKEDRCYAWEGRQHFLGGQTDMGEIREYTGEISGVVAVWGLIHIGHGKFRPLGGVWSANLNC